MLQNYAKNFRKPVRNGITLLYHTAVYPYVSSTMVMVDLISKQWPNVCMNNIRHSSLQNVDNEYNEICSDNF